MRTRIAPWALAALALGLLPGCLDDGTVDNGGSSTVDAAADTGGADGGADAKAGDTKTGGDAGGDTGTATDTGGADGTTPDAAGDAGGTDAAMDAGNDTGGDVPPVEPNCADYCSAVQAACTGAWAQYPSIEECLDYCGAVAFLPPGEAGDTDGNTIGCRTYHATVAAQPGMAEAHCPHAGPTGGDVCGTWCDNYCHLAQKNCTGGDALYADDAACMTACEAFPADGAIGATDGDSVQCRLYHLGVAGSSPPASAATHCPHAAPDGGGVCVDEAPADPTCAEYCAAVSTACTGDDAQYASEADCLTYCQDLGKLPAGSKDDTAGNTIGCRLYHAGVAAGEGMAATHCPHAGPTGGDVCGTWCENYCHLADSNCTGNNALYGSEADCATACAAFSTDGALGAADGDSVQCRIYHLGIAGGDGAAATHCPHGAPDGGDVCVEPEPPAPTCEAYCAEVTGACTGEYAQYASEADCLTWCKDLGKLPAGTADDTAGNTIGCRIYHATVAAQPGNAATHCPHAGPSGGDVCGSWCTNYCHLATANCTGDNAIYPNEDKCLEACLGIPEDGTPGATDGDSIQCRIYHLGVAGADAASAATHCPHGALDGGGVCVEPPPVPTCEEYCAAVMDACTGANAQYGSQIECMTYCEDWAQLPGGSYDDVAGNTVGCRLYHAGVAGMPNMADLHCDHAGPSGGDVCGSWCENYCWLETTNCTGDASLYADMDSCLGECAAFPTSGGANAVDGDSVQCRIYHLGVAGSNPPASGATHCPHGAPDGGGVCVDPTPTCGEYCAAVTDACTGGDAQYASLEACLAYCNVAASLPGGSYDDTSGNTIGCRLYHAQVAAEPGNAATHCPHAGPTGGDVCGSLCDNYCHLSEVNCDTSLFTSSEECLSTCASYPQDGQLGDGSGNTVQCRLYHLGVAGSDKPTSSATHCPHGGADGGGVCVDPAPTCADYCAAVTTSCTGDDAQYASEAACLTYCQGWANLPAGTTADTSGNTLGCRIYHAGVAATPGMAATHCPHAGPTGGDVCGSLCDNYCHLAMTNCTAGNALYSNEAQCQTACATLHADGAQGDADGDTVQCRIYHLGVAGSNPPDSNATHCPHGGADGGGVCVDPVGPTPTCADYCAAVTLACTGDDAQYASEQACLDYCDGWASLPAGTTADTSGNTLGCRIYHAEVASQSAGNAATHCPHAGPTGGDVCGSWCDNYCHLAMTNCTAGNELFASEAACQTACAGYSAGGATGDADGDTVQCRIYHLGVAGSNPPDSNTTHCPHGGADGGGVCVDPGPADPTCADYCAEVTAACTGDNAQYASEQACLDYCGTAALLPIGTLGDTSGNTVGCRMYHAGVAAQSAGNAATHCPHAGPTGGDVCGSWCDNYCHLALTNCTGGNALYAGQADCEMTCAQFATDGAQGDADGDTIQCRLYHLGVAGTDQATSAAIHCPHGAYDGGGVCVDPAPQTTFADVQPVYNKYCGGCHTGGGSGGHNIGSTNLATAYADSQKASYLCPGKTKGACTIEQIQSGYMPLGKGCSGDPATDAAKPACLTAQDQATIQAWIDDGQLQ